MIQVIRLNVFPQFWKWLVQSQIFQHIVRMRFNNCEKNYTMHFTVSRLAFKTELYIKCSASTARFTA